MNLGSIALLSVAMSTDAFAAAVGKGTSLERPRWPEALRTGAIFGVIEASTPLVGWALGVTAAGSVKTWDHWIAFVLLGILGLRMIRSGCSPQRSDEKTSEKPRRHAFWVLAATGFATSIDAMAVGAGLALLDVPIVPVAVAIGATTFLAVTAGVMLGRVLGSIAGRRAEVFGGVVLVTIGAMILIEHVRA
jgi:putative Mn2+ efflux pump MntP